VIEDLLARFGWAGGHADVWPTTGEVGTCFGFSARRVVPAIECCSSTTGSRPGARPVPRERLVEECGATFRGLAAIVDQAPPDPGARRMHVHALVPSELLGADA